MQEVQRAARRDCERHRLGLASRQAAYAAHYRLRNRQSQLATISQDETMVTLAGGMVGTLGIVAAVGEMTAVVKEYTKQRERDTALPKWLTNCGVLRRSDTSSTHVLSLEPPAARDINAEILIGSRRFH